MKKPISKADIRAELEEEIQSFLTGGGEVENVPRGLSGKNANEAPMFLNRRLFVEPRGERTLVPEVVAAIESRRKEKPKPPPSKTTRVKKQRRKTIYDDFGEPLRTVWVEE